MAIIGAMRRINEAVPRLVAVEVARFVRPRGGCYAWKLRRRPGGELEDDRRCNETAARRKVELSDY